MKLSTLSALVCLFLVGCTPATKETEKSTTPAKNTTPPIQRPKHNYDVRSVAFSSDGKLLAVGMRNNWAEKTGLWGAADIWNVSTRKKLARWHFRDTITNTAFLMKRGLLITTSQNGMMEIWSMKTKRLCHSMKATSDSAYYGAIAVSPDEKWIALGGEVWDTRKWRKQSHSAGIYYGAIKAVTFSPDGTKLVIGCFDVGKGTEVHSVKSGRRLWVGIGDHNENDMAWSPDSKYLAVAYYSVLTILNPKNGRLVKNLANRLEVNGQPVFMPDSKSLLHVTENEIIQYQLPSGKILNKVSIKKADFSVVSPNGRTLAQVSSDSKEVRFSTL